MNYVHLRIFILIYELFMFLLIVKKSLLSIFISVPLRNLYFEQNYYYCFDFIGSRRIRALRWKSESREMKICDLIFLMSLGSTDFSRFIEGAKNKIQFVIRVIVNILSVTEGNSTSKT